MPGVIYELFFFLSSRFIGTFDILSELKLIILFRRVNDVATKQQQKQQKIMNYDYFEYLA